MSGSIYHITRRSEWESAQAGGVYTADSLFKSGFIHCSSHEQVFRVANFLYHGQTDLVLLEIDPSRLQSEVRWEPGSDKADELFPHVYGPLNLEAVRKLIDLQPGEAGDFSPLP